MRVLVFGSTGQVAVELARAAALRDGLAITALSRAEADLSDPAACAAAIDRAEADCVINAAAYTAVDTAEEEETLATQINAESPGAMAAAAARRSLPFLHISTDYVFDGAQTARAWVETDPTNPQNAYGRSKLAGEAAVLAAGEQTVVIRTAWVFAAHGANFVKTMLRVGAERPELKVVDDQRGGPTAAADIASALLTIAEAFRAGRGVGGVFHFAGAPVVSWREFAAEIFAQSALPQKPAVMPIASSDWPTPAARPANSALNCSKIETVYGIAQPDWRRSLTSVIEEIEGGST